ncbi:hypothetical protein ACIQM3_06790 [Streptomyces sp. NPDC091271]|uniref:hypothetical protein n=1 Tax=Streptomyces sp. NPDC091271 TaxID=3365980 RepID=UPI00382F8715
MTPEVLVAAELAGRWEGPPWFKWAFLAVWALFGLFLFLRFRKNGWKLPRRR